MCVCALSIFALLCLSPIASSETSESLEQIKSPGAMNSQAMGLAKAGRIDDAAAHFAEALTLYPSNAMLNNNYGVTLMRQGNYEDAMNSFDKALVSDPANDNAIRNKADLVNFLEKRQGKGATPRAQDVLGQKDDLLTREDARRRSGHRTNDHLNRSRRDEELVQLMASTVNQSTAEDLSYFNAPGINSNANFEHTVMPLPVVHIKDMIRGGPKVAAYVRGISPFKLVGLHELRSWGGNGFDVREDAIGLRASHKPAAAFSSAAGGWRNLSLAWFESRFPGMVVDAYPHNMEASSVSPWMTSIEQAAIEYRSEPQDTMLRRSPRRPGAVYLQLNLNWAQWEQVRAVMGVLPAQFETDQLWLRACFPDDHLRNEFLRSTHWKMALLGSSGGPGMFNHWDVIRTSSWQVQTKGRKRWHICSPSQHGLMYDAGKVDTFHPDYERAPRFRQARCYLDTVGPGEALYYPMDWWHQTESLDETVSISASIADSLNYQKITTELRAECRGSAPKRISSASDPMCAALERCFAWWGNAFDGGAIASDNSSHVDAADGVLDDRHLAAAGRIDQALQTQAGLFGHGKLGAAEQGFEERCVNSVLQLSDRGFDIPDSAVDHTKGAAYPGRKRLGIGSPPTGWGSWPLAASGMMREHGMHAVCPRAPPSW